MDLSSYSGSPRLTAACIYTFFSSKAPQCYSSYTLVLSNPPLRLMLLLAVPAAMVIGTTVLALETDGAVGHEVADARVARSEDGEAHDNACDILGAIFFVDPHEDHIGVDAPRGNSSGGIDLRRRRRWEVC